MVGFLIAIISGALMSVQGVFNTKLTESTSLWVANAFVQFTAFLLCPAFCPHRLFLCLAVYRQDFFCDAYEGRTEVYAPWRRHRGIYHLYSDPQYGNARTGKSGHADRDCPASCCLYD